jgi:phage I-like protein
MPHLEAFALKATGKTKTLAAPVQTVMLAAPTVGVGRHVGLTGADPEKRTTWIHVAMHGEWEGHPSGAFSLDRKSFAQCIAALRACKTPPPVDYDHASLRPLDGQPTPAAGYVLDLALRDDGLWALVELTQRAADMVRGGEYRFCSGVFVWDAADRETGEPIPCQLDSIGLTNKPFIDGQHAIRLSRRALGAASMDIDKKDLMGKIDALASGATISAKQLEALVEFIKASAEEMPEVEVEVEAPEGEEKPEGEMAEMACKPDSKAASRSQASLAAAPPAMPSAPMAVTAVMPEAAEVVAEAESGAESSQDAAAMLLTKLAELTGLDTASLMASLDANSEQIVAAFQGANGGAMPYSALSAKATAQEAVIAELTREVGAYRSEQAKRADAELVAEVEAHIAAGRILPGSRESFVALARKAPAEFRALAKSLPVRVPLAKEAPVVAPTSSSSSLAAANIDASHPRYVELHKAYSDPSNPYARTFPTDASARAETIDRLVRNHLRREQPITG